MTPWPTHARTLPVQLSAAAEFFGFDDTQKDVYLGGYVNVAFFAVGAPAALLVGGGRGGRQKEGLEKAERGVAFASALSLLADGVRSLE